ncbi:Multicopper oxidase [Sergentomyia squamirostris]
MNPEQNVTAEIIECCAEIEKLCDQTRCPIKPAACKEDYYEIVSKKGKCCDEYFCAPPKDKCIVTINGTTTLKNLGDIWNSVDPCSKYSCDYGSEGITEVTTIKEYCTNSCNNGYQLKPVLGQCCGECVQKTSVVDKDYNNYEEHPCKRDCVAGSPPKLCKYKFIVEWYETLSKACYNCPSNATDCSRPHCITGDGTRKSVLVINRMMPGPTINVCFGDKIIVDLQNNLLGETTSIHWHGMHQRRTPYMDGVPFVSQCPISQKQTFRYNFYADKAGTHFYHSHTGVQRGDGSLGALIVRLPRSEDVHAKLYDHDEPKHLMVLQDWTTVTGISMFNAFHHSNGDNKPQNILINGKGRWWKAAQVNNVLHKQTNPRSLNDLLQNKRSPESHETYLNETKLMPLQVFTVVENKRYRLRLVNAEFLNCPMEISVDNHTMTVIASDGSDIKPVEVETLVTYAGERFDFVIAANQKPGNYWIRVKGLMDCDARSNSAHQVAILRYNGTVEEEPLDVPNYEYQRLGRQLNALNRGVEDSTTISITETNSAHQDPKNGVLKDEADIKFFIAYDFYAKNNTKFYIPGLYGFNEVLKSSQRKSSPQLNHISMKLLSYPLMTARNLIDDSLFCNSSTFVNQGIDCRADFCHCPHVLQVKLNAVVEMVLIDEGYTYDSNHPFHLHGNDFHVIGMEKLNGTASIERVKEMDKNGELYRRLKGSPIKDTVTVPHGGYTIIRFKANNPGYWLFHCHIEFHAEIGMALVVKVGEHSDMLSVPRNLPTC